MSFKEWSAAHTPAKAKDATAKPAAKAPAADTAAKVTKDPAEAATPKS